MKHNINGLFLDFETTGLNASSAYPTQLGAVKFIISTELGSADLPIVTIGNTFYTMIKPPCWSDNKDDYEKALEIQGLSREYIDEHGVPTEEAYLSFCTFLEDIGYINNNEIMSSRMWAHNSEFDFNFLTRFYLLSGVSNPRPTSRNNINCTKKLFSSLGQLSITSSEVPDNLNKVCVHYGIPMIERDTGIHNPVEDVHAGIHVLQHILQDIQLYYKRTYEQSCSPRQWCPDIIRR